MRKAGALATVVLLALAFVASGCDLVSSLTPFGIGTKDYSATGANVNGAWAGKTGNNGNVTFQVANEAVSELIVQHITAGCTLSLEADTLTAPIVNNRFTIEVALTQGRFVASGTFTSATTCSGTYSFEALPAGDCPTAGSGTFTANKTF